MPERKRRPASLSHQWAMVNPKRNMKELAALQTKLAFFVFFVSSLTSFSAAYPSANASPNPKADPSHLRPTIGYDTWNTFGYELTAENLTEVADAMVTSGLQAAGYSTIVLGGGWACSRDKETRELRPCPDRFPKGLQWSIDDLRARGFRIGVVLDRQDETLDQFVQLGAYYKDDIKLLAKWKVDLVQVDTFSETTERHDQHRPSFQAFREELIVQAPAVQLKVSGCPKQFRDAMMSPNNQSTSQRSPTTCRIGSGMVPFWDYFAKMDTLFTGPSQLLDRDSTTNQALSGVNDLWTRSSILEIVDLNSNFYSDRPMSTVWNDMGPLMVGLDDAPLRLRDTRVVPASSLSVYHQLSQFALWCFLKSPIIAINDIRGMSTIAHRILTHKGLLAIHGESTSAPARKVISKPPLYDIFAAKFCGKYESPRQCNSGGRKDVAVLVVNRRTNPSVGDLGPIRISFSDIGLCEYGCSVVAENVLDSSVISGSGTGILTDSIPYGGVAIFRISSTGSAQVPRALNALREIFFMGVYWNDGSMKSDHLHRGLQDIFVVLGVTLFVFLLGSTVFIPPRKTDQ